jgi:hypothetical protein
MAWKKDGASQTLERSLQKQKLWLAKTLGDQVKYESELTRKMLEEFHLTILDGNHTKNLLRWPGLQRMLPEIALDMRIATMDH